MRGRNANQLQPARSLENSLVRDFISKEERRFRAKLGWHIASALSGFIAGVIAASVVWFAVVYVLKVLSK